MGYEPRFRLLPWKRAYRTVAEGEAAMLFTFTKNPEREKDFFFTDALAEIEVIFFKRKADKITWETFDELKNYRIGYVDGYNYGSSFMEAIREKKFSRPDMLGASEMADYQQFLKLSGKRIDLAVCVKSEGLHLIRNNAPAFDDLDYIDKPVGPARGFFCGFSRKWPDAKSLRDRFDKEYGKFKAEGKKAAIFDKYGISASAAPC
ncbi:hypothetical protein DENIS_1191 [Desulfonema ishimotonii]|uniref:Solute-binding protein family 3/N-terminal domain-containing protein n=2 Tax=Desulfonema ishimotonii TaxID=45657 RepID=A0A401FTG2_9BACT|nr:hypothetical protein DENIS_1191 [Desulfonema ishimotonii]